MKNLKDAKLFRQQCYIDGAWADADESGTIVVTNPANDQKLGTVPSFWSLDGLLTTMLPPSSASNQAPSM